VDSVQDVGLFSDVSINEASLFKMQAFLSAVLFGRSVDDNETVVRPCSLFARYTDTQGGARHVLRIR
jgi:hypothetical protein